MSISTRPGGALYVASDGSGTYAFIKANDHYISPWWMGISSAHGIAALTLWGADQNTGYTILGGYGNTYINATPAGSIALRVGNAEKVNVSSTYCTIYPTISCNAISCASVSSNGHAINANGGPIYGGGLDVGAGGITGGGLYLGTGGINCGNINAGSGNIYCGALSASVQVYATNIYAGGIVRASQYGQGDWTTWGLLSRGDASLAASGYHNGTYASGFRTHYGMGERIETINYNQSLHVPFHASVLTQNSSITLKKEVRSLRPGRERSVVHLDPFADTVEQPDIMALRPVVFRYRSMPTRLDPETGEPSPEPEDTVLGREARREHLGLIAEEAQHVVPSSVIHEADGSAKGMDYSQITVAMLDHVQRLTDEIATLRYWISELMKGNHP